MNIILNLCVSTQKFVCSLTVLNITGDILFHVYMLNFIILWGADGDWWGKLGYYIFTLGRDFRFLPMPKAFFLIAFPIAASILFSGKLLFTINNPMTKREEGKCVCVCKLFRAYQKKFV